MIVVGVVEERDDNCCCWRTRMKKKHVGVGIVGIVVGGVEVGIVVDGIAVGVGVGFVGTVVVVVEVVESFHQTLLLASLFHREAFSSDSRTYDQDHRVQRRNKTKEQSTY